MRGSDDSFDHAGTLIGTRLSNTVSKASVIWTDDAELRPHVDRAWMRAYASAHSGLATPSETGSQNSQFSIPDWALERHTCLFGATGGGKSRLALHLVSEHLQQGGSTLVLDPKPQTIEHLLDRCRTAGMKPEQIVVLDPASPDCGVPGWNPLISGLPPAQAAADLVAILKQNSDSWGPRLSDILTNALVLLGAYQLSIYEVPRLLTRADYRAALLRLPLPAQEKSYSERPISEDQVAYPSERKATPRLGRAAVVEARAFFAHEFSAWPRSEQVGAVAPVLTRVRSLLGSDFLQPLLCARRNTLDLPSLWQRPGAVLVHLDRTALGDDGARLLGGLLAHQIYRTALRSPGPVPVLLALDELGGQEHFIGSALIDIVTIGRSQNLRLLAATQHLTKLSTELREALLANAGVQAAFQTGFDDARMLGTSFSVGTEDSLSHAAATVASRDRLTGQAERTTWRHLIRDGSGHPLRLSKSAWRDFSRFEAIAPPGKAAALLRVQSLAAAAGATRLYVHAADTEEAVALSRYVRGLPEEDYWFDGPAPLELVVSFPRPKFTSIRRESASDLAGRWTRDIHQLPKQYTAIRVRGCEPEIVRIVDVETSDEAGTDSGWIAEARAAGTQTYEEIEEVAAWRSAQVEEVASGRAAVSSESPTLNTVQKPVAQPKPSSGMHVETVPSDIAAASNNHASISPIEASAARTGGISSSADDVFAAEQPEAANDGTIGSAVQAPFYEEVDDDGSIA